MSKTLRYGFIGCGMMGQEHLRNLAILPGSVVTRIFEPDDAMAAKSLALAPHARRVGSLAAVITDEAVDAIVVTSPNMLHAAQLQAIGALRALPVLLEKPACTSARDADVLEAWGRQYPAPVWVAMEYRYMPPIARWLELIRQGSATGPLAMLSIREHRFPFLTKVGDWNRFNENTGGTLVEKCCHFFDLMRLATGSEPTTIHAVGGQAHNHLEERYAGRTPDILDHAYVIASFANGMRAMLELCMFAEGSRWQEELSAVGPQGKVECFVPGPPRFWPAHLGPQPVPRLVLSPRHPAGPVEMDAPVDEAALAAGDHHGATFEQHRRFRQAVLGDGPVEVSLADGLAAVRMGLRAQASLAQGG